MYREWDSNSANQPKSEGFRRRNGRESEGAWQDEDLYLHAERTRDENIWKRERVEERMSRHAHKIDNHKSDRYREWDSNSANQPKSEGFRRRNGRESEGAWQDEDLYLHAERTRDENIWKRERVEERMSRHAHKIPFGYGALIFIPSWSFVKCRHKYAVSSLMDTAYRMSELVSSYFFI
nr:hypothetical protein [Tanacetum cinerariifolium]